MNALLAEIGVTALWLLYAWLALTILSSLVSARKGYGEKFGLAFGMILFALGLIVVLVLPAKPDSLWKTEGAIPKRRRRKADAT